MMVIEKDGSTKIIAKIPTVSFSNQNDEANRDYPDQIHPENGSKTPETCEKYNQSENKQTTIPVYQNDLSDSLQEPQTDHKSQGPELNIIDTQRADPEEMRVLREQVAQMSQQI